MAFVRFTAKVWFSSMSSEAINVCLFDYVSHLFSLCCFRVFTCGMCLEVSLAGGRSWVALAVLLRLAAFFWRVFVSGSLFRVYYVAVWCFRVSWGLGIPAV